MKKIMLAFLMILLIAGASYAQLTDFFDNITKKVQQEGDPFIQATETVTGTPAAAYDSVFQAFDPGYCGGAQFELSMGWISATAAAIMLVVLVITLIWMFGMALQSQNLIHTAKEEAFQALLTVLRVIFIIWIAASLNGWFAMKTSGITFNEDKVYGAVLTPLGTPTVIDGAMGVARYLIVEMVTDYSNLVMYNMVIHTLYSSTMWFGVTWRAMYSFNLGPVLKPLIDIVGMALNYLSLGIGEWMLHLVLLCMIKRWTWTLFIPLSIFLRTFPPTRGAGEALFAVIFALFIIYPFMFLVTYETHKLLENNLIEGDSAVGSFVKKSGILAVAGSVIVTMFLAAGVFFPFFVGMALNLAFELIRNAVYYVVIISLLLPFLNIFITLTAAKEIARFFSVDVSFMSFIKII